MTRYMPAEGVDAISEQLIAACHEELTHADIEYHFVAKYDSYGLLKDVEPGDTLSWQQVIPRQFRVLHEDMGHFSVGILFNWWQDASAEQRGALVDHCLCHLEFEQSESPGHLPDTCRIIKHDFEGFRAELARHGCWTEELRDAFGQLTLFDPEGPEVTASITLMGEDLG